MLKMMMETARSKICFKCGIEKPIDEFYKHSKMADGHLNKCKECTKKDVRENKEDNSEYYKAYDRIRSREDINRKEARKEYQKRDYVRKARYVHNTNYKYKYPERYSARHDVRKALKSGILTKLPCFICGEENTQGHHPDYSSPLDVVWLCVEHHSQCHLEYDPETDKITLSK
jgi:hypothetical protein